MDLLSGEHAFPLSHVIASLSVFALLFYVVSTHRKRQKRFANIPPGPKPWPVVGNFGHFLIPPFLRGLLQQQQQQQQQSGDAVASMTALSKVYGDVFSLFAGPTLMVVLNGYKVVRDALSNHPEVFSDRPDIPAIAIMTKRKGVKVKARGPDPARETISSGP